jgi:hypothetical protein
MTDIRTKTRAELETCKALIEEICAGMESRPHAGKHMELGRRLYAALGEIHTDDWPELFGRGGIGGPSYLGTAYSGARLERADRIIHGLPFVARKANHRREALSVPE